MIHKFDQKHINLIRNVDDSFKDDLAVVEKALEIAAQMCNPPVEYATFYIDTDSEGKLKLGMEF